MTDRIQDIQHNLTATSAPAASDDTDLGYSVGSIWADQTNDEAYVCLDATADSAVWEKVTQAAEIAALTASDVGAVDAGSTVSGGGLDSGTAHATDGSTDNEFLDFDNASAATVTLNQGTAGHVVYASNRQNTVAAAAGAGVTLLGDATTATTGADKLLIARWLTTTDVFVAIH